MSSPLVEIAHRLGGDLYAGGTRALVPGPGHSPGDRSLSLWLASNSRIVWHSFAGDSARDVFEHLGIDRAAEASPEERRQAQRERQEWQQAHRARAWRFCEAVWSETLGIEATPAQTYLAGRGLVAPTTSDLRFHPSAPMNYEASQRAPAMVALVRSAAGRAVGLHLTAIKPDGSGKAWGHRSRRMFGPVRGGAVRLFNRTDDGVLAIGEGIETSLAFAQIRKAPAWSALSTAGLSTFELPLGVRHLIIAADADAAGLEAARALADRAKRRCEVLISAPEAGDWADVLQERK